MSLSVGGSSGGGSLGAIAKSVGGVVGINADDLEKLFIDYECSNYSNIEKLIKEIDEKIKNHPKLRDEILIEKDIFLNCMY